MIRRLILPVLPVLAVLLGAAGSSPASSGAAIVAHGAPGGIISCRVCHGMRLQGKPAIGAPALAGLPARITLPAFAAIASGQRGKNFVMQKIARTLTPPQRRALAAYLAGVTPEPAS